ncbi:MAG: hypothetical protein J7521_19890 [Caulobacter sp.]|nr:hypothetical protein [Caulobacter sp.]
MPKEEIVSDVAPGEYNAVVTGADLIDVKLISSTFNVEPVFFSQDKGKMNLSFGCEVATQFYLRDERKIIGTFLMEAGSKIGRKWVLRAKSTYLVVFDVEGDPSEEGALSYLRRIGKFVCYPYFRAHFAELCSGAGAEMPPLPVMRGNVPRKIPEILEKELD